MNGGCGGSKFSDDVVMMFCVGRKSRLGMWPEL